MGGFFGGGGGASASDMVGATSSDAGTAGLVPAPAAGQQDLFLRGDGTFVEGLLPQRTFTAGYFLSCAMGNGSGTTSAAGQRTHYNTILIPKRMTFDRIGIRCATAGVTHNIRIGLYNASATTGYPSTVKLDAGEITLNGAATYTVTINLTLDAGVYWGAVYTGSSGWSFDRYVADYVRDFLRGLSSSTNTTPSQDFPYSQSIPANSGTAFGDNPTLTALGQTCPAIFLRVA